MSSIASSIVAKARWPARRACPSSYGGSSRSTYFASTSTSRLTASPGESPPRVVTSSVCGTSATEKRVVENRRDRQRDPVDRDEPLLDAVADDLGRSVEGDTNAVAFPSLHRANSPDSVHVALDDVTPSGSPARSAGSRLTASPSESAAQRLGEASVERVTPAVLDGDRESGSSRRQSSRHPRAVCGCRVELETNAVVAALDRRRPGHAPARAL